MRTVLLAAALNLAALGYPVLNPAQSIAFRADQPPRIPFRLASGYLIVVEGSIGDLHRLHFIIDTGTTRTCVDYRLAQKLALPLSPPRTVFRFGQAVRLDSTILPSLSFGPLRAEHFTVDVADVSHLKLDRVQIDAIVGLDLLEAFPFQIDYVEMRISFGSIQTLAESTSMEQIPWLPIVSLDFDHLKYLVLIDTGARNMIFYSEKLNSAYHRLKPMGTEIWADSIGGMVQARKALFLRTSDGNVRANEVFLIHAPLDGPLSSTDGILSPMAFGIRQIGFDFKNRVVTWSR